MKESLKAALQEAAQQGKDSGVFTYETLPDFVLEIPRDKNHGDFAANLAMVLTKQAKMPPRQIGEYLVNTLSAPEWRDKLYIEKMELAGPGFINFYLQKRWLTEEIKEILSRGSAHGNCNLGQGQKVQIEFVSANPTGELHMGNARGAALGDSLANIMTAAGYEVSREYYINDAGNQIVKFGLSLEARYLQCLGEDVEFPEDGYHGEDITRTMEEFIAEHGDKYKDVDADLRREMLTKYALEKKITAIREGLLRFGVKYDVWFSEQSLHDSGAITEVIQRLQEKGCIYEKDDALWIKGEVLGDEKDEVIVRANGIPTYFAADIAYHENKYSRGFDQAINIWGADHHGHVARMQGAMEALGYDRERLHIILMQLVRLIQDGEVVKMSKRTGTYVTLEELMDDIGVDAARFFFCMRSADSQLDFDLDLAKAQSADNPVFYVQYAHARIHSILAQNAEDGFVLPALDQIDFSLLTHESEIDLIHKLMELPEEIAYSATHMEPYRIAVYAQDLAAFFHGFYANCRVLGVDDNLRAARLWLISGVATAIAKCLGILGVTAPEKM
ncbi:MAG: arginine--tRNA ligase [Peptococcaceae bacterium]|nr:arginine--tRNA ligase [Peptococcaceae bacterium]